MLAQQQLSEKIKQIFLANRCRYGSRRIRQELLKSGLSISRRRVSKLMKKSSLVCKIPRKFKRTTDSEHAQPIAPNLLNRSFNPSQANEAYVGDITYVWTETGWLYLAVVIDLFSRKAVGWAMSNTMQAKLVNDALQMAIDQRKPAKGLISHTDRGSQYASDSHRALLANNGIIQSMSRKGNCWDNAVAESFFHTLKTELVHRKKFNTIEEAKLEIFYYIHVYYNQRRMHSANGYMSPMEFEQLHKIT